MPSRRAYLAALSGTLAATAGCLSSGDGTGGDDDTVTPVGSPTDSPEPPTDGIVVENIGVAKAVTYESFMGSGGVLAAEGKQYVVCSVRADTDISASAFTFEADGDSWSPGLPDTAGARNRSVAGRSGGRIGYPSGSPDDGSYLAFVVPSPLSASNPRIRYTVRQQREWPLDSESQERLAASEPRFERESLTVPEEVRQGEDLEVTLEVRNVSETDGRFLAAIYWPTEGIADDDESHIVERDVAAGEAETVSRTIDTRYTALEDGPVSLTVRGHVSGEREVYVRGTSTPS